MFLFALEFGALLEWVQHTRLATTISQSLTLTAILSSIHLVGLTVLVGAVLLSTLRLLGLIFPDHPVRDVTVAAGGAILLGLAISAVSGLLLVAPRASASFNNGFFQFKMLSLLAAMAFHVGVYRQVIRRTDVGRPLLRLTGALDLGLWFAVAVAGCAFILLE